MTTMVANATRVAAVAEDATRLLGLRSPGERAVDVTATKRRHAQLSPGRIGTPVRSQVLSNAVDPGAGIGAGSPLAALLDQPGFVAPALVGTSEPSGVGGETDVAVADLPPPAFTPGGIVILGGGGSAGGGSGGSSGGGSASSGGGSMTSTGGTTATGSTGGNGTTSTGGTSTTGGTTSTSTGGISSTSGGTTTSSGGSTTSGGVTSTSTGGTTSTGGDPIDPNVPAVPEPSTWLMMLAGFAAIGTALRRAVRHSPARSA